MTTKHRFRGTPPNRALCLFAGLLFAPRSRAAPSFDCQKASSETEKAVCGDEVLAALDVMLSKTYDKALKEKPESTAAIKQTQKQWLKNRADCGDGYDCLKTAYLQRIAALGFPDLSPPVTDAKLDSAIDFLRGLKLSEMTGDERPELLMSLADRFDLEDLTCRFFKRDPKKAVKLFAPYYGSNKDNFIPSCSKIDVADSVASMKVFLEQLQQVQGQETNCAGTMRYAQYLTEHNLRIMAAVDPAPDLEEAKRNHQQRAKRVASWGTTSTQSRHPR